MLVGQNTKIPKYWWGREGVLLAKFRIIGWETACSTLVPTPLL